MRVIGWAAWPDINVRERVFPRESIMDLRAEIGKAKAQICGAVMLSGDDGFDASRQIWNAMIDRTPAAIVRCAGVADVVRAVQLARDLGLPVSIKGGGHNVAGNAVAENGMMIDLAGMRAVRVDPYARTARVEGGATWRELDHEAHAFGLATTGGIIPATGVAGLTLGGGLGWLMRKHGLSCDNLVSVDMVGADGRLFTASAEQNAELFWGLRGGGGNFGVATSLEYRVHEVETVTAGMTLYPLSEAGAALQFMRDFAATAPDDLAVMGVLMTTPDGAKALALIVCHCGSVADGARDLAPLRRFGKPLADTIAPIAYPKLQGLLEGGFPPGRHNYWKSSFLRELSDPAITTLVDNFATVTSPTSAIAVELLGGAVARVPEHATAFNHRKSRFNFLVVSSWTGSAGSDAHVTWTRRVWSAMQPFASDAVYVNYLGRESDEGGDRIREAYGAEKFARLQALKRHHDPDNVFRFNQNIRG